MHSTRVHHRRCPIHYFIPLIWKLGPKVIVWYARLVMSWLSRHSWYWSLLALSVVVGLDIVLVFQHLVPVAYDWILVLTTSPFVLDICLRIARKQVENGHLEAEKLDTFLTKSLDLLETMALTKSAKELKKSSKLAS
jgi:hypothetical protein